MQCEVPVIISVLKTDFYVKYMKTNKTCRITNNSF